MGNYCNLNKDSTETQPKLRAPEVQPAQLFAYRLKRPDGTTLRLKMNPNGVDYTEWETTANSREVQPELKAAEDQHFQIFAYRVTKPGGTSLELKRNPNGVNYKDAINGKNGGVFSLPKHLIKKGCDDWGGIWVAPTLSAAKKYVDYMAEKHGILGCRIFIVLLGEILFEVKHSRIKTDSITFIAEIEETEVEN